LMGHLGDDHRTLLDKYHRVATGSDVSLDHLLITTDSEAASCWGEVGAMLGGL
jgi:hypothetical protein